MALDTRRHGTVGVGVLGLGGDRCFHPPASRPIRTVLQSNAGAGKCGENDEVFRVVKEDRGSA